MTQTQNIASDTATDLETEARQLREKLYGPISDQSWDNIKHDWLRDIDWLRAQTKSVGDEVTSL